MPKTYTLKASNDTYTLYLHDDVAIDEMFIELDELMDHLKMDPKRASRYQVSVNTGNRFLTDSERNKLYDTIETDTNWRITSIESDVIPLEKAKEWNKSVNTRVEIGTVESGQLIEAEGDILIIGDVLAGGMVRATGNIFHLGELNGVLDAGITGNNQAIIIGDFQNNSEIRINKKVQLLSFSQEERESFFPKIYYLDDEDSLLVAPISELTNIRPNSDIVNNIYHEKY